MEGKKKRNQRWTHTDDIISARQNRVTEVKCAMFPDVDSSMKADALFYTKYRNHFFQQTPASTMLDIPVSKGVLYQKSHKSVKFCDNYSHHSDRFVVGCAINDDVECLNMILVVFA